MAGVKFARPALRSLRQQVMEELRTAVVQGRIQPGERLVEADLAASFGVSRGCVREALRGLEHEGLIVSSPYRETHVASTSEEEVIDVLLPVRVVIEVFAARKLAGRLEPSQLLLLEQLIDEMRMAAAGGDRLTLTQLDIDFHRRLLTFAGIPTIQSIWAGINARIRGRFLLDTAASDPEQLVQLHEELLAALRSGPPEIIGPTIVRHIYGALPPHVAQNGAPPAIRSLIELLQAAELVSSESGEGNVRESGRPPHSPSTTEV